MQTQRDHVHAHTFMMGRLSSALVEGNSTNAQLPGRRPLIGMLLGIILAVLVVAGFGVYGWLRPGGSKEYKQKGAILVEKETGTRYVYLGGKLHVTPNMTSAMLLEGSSAHVELISRDSLKDVARGPALGIADAPQTVPTPGDMVRGPWLACLPGSVVDRTGDAMGLNLNPSAPATPLADDAFTVVRSSGGTTYVVAQGHKYPVGSDSVLVALGATNARPIPAPDSWLQWLPTGDTLNPPSIPNAGAPGPQIAGRSRPVGTLFRQRASGRDPLFVLLDDGLAPISHTAFLLANAVDGAHVVSLTAADVVAAPRSDDRSLAGKGLPKLGRLRWKDPGDRVLCMRQRPAGKDSVSNQVVFTDRGSSGVSAKGHTSTLMKAGTGMLVLPEKLPDASEAGQPVFSGNDVSFLITDGVAYRLGGTKAAAALKLGSGSPVLFPRPLLIQVRQGPSLSPSAASQPAER